MTATLPDSQRHPIRDAASTVSRVTGLIGSLVTALAGYGILTVVQGDAILALLGAIPGLITLVTTVLAVFSVVRRAEPETTPMADPRSHEGRPLVVDSGQF